MSDNLYKRGATWWGRIQAGGREYRRSLRTGDRAEAQRRLEAWRKEVVAAVHYGEHRLTWPAAVLRYVQEIMPQAVKPSTAKRYLVSLRQVDSHLSDYHVDRITRPVLAALITARTKAGATNATINRDLTAVSAVLGAAVHWGVLDRNPCDDLDRRRVTRERRDPIVLPASQDVQRVIDRAPGLFAKLIRFAALTGMRQEEIASLTWAQVDLAAGAVRLTNTKTSRPRSVPLSPAAAALLSSLPRTLTMPRFVFWHGTGDRYSNVASRFREMCRSAQESAQPGTGFRPFRFHDLRHLFAVEALRAGMGIYEVQQVLGHSTIKTTEIYLAYLTPEEAAGAKSGSAQKPAHL